MEFSKEKSNQNQAHEELICWGSELLIYRMCFTSAMSTYCYSGQTRGKIAKLPKMSAMLFCHGRAYFDEKNIEGNISLKNSSILLKNSSIICTQLFNHSGNCELLEKPIKHLVCVAFLYISTLLRADEWVVHK